MGFIQPVLHLGHLSGSSPAPVSGLVPSPER